MWGREGERTSEPIQAMLPVSNRLVSSGSGPPSWRAVFTEVYRLLLQMIHAREEERHLSDPLRLPLVWVLPPAMNSFLVPSRSVTSAWKGKTWKQSWAVRRAHTKCDDAVKLSCLWGVRSSRSKVAEAEMSGQTLKKPRSEVRHKRCLVYKLIYKETFFLNRSVVSMLFWGTIMNSD